MWVWGAHWGSRWKFSGEDQGWCKRTKTWGSLVGIATRYGLDCQGIEWRLGRDFSHPCRPALGPTQHSVQRVPAIPGGKQLGRCVNHSRGLSKRRATLLIPYCAFVAGYGVNFTFLPFTYSEVCWETVPSARWLLLPSMACARHCCISRIVDLRHTQLLSLRICCCKS